VFPRLLIASLVARRARVVLGLLAVTLGVGVATALAALAIEVGDDLARSLRAAGPNFVVLPQGASWPLDVGGADVEVARAGLTLPEESVAGLKGSFWRHNILEAAPELAVDARIGDEPATLAGAWFDHPVTVEDGIWRTGLARLRPAWSLDGRWPSETAAEVVLGARLADRLGARPGQSVEIGVTGRREPWLVTGVVRAGGRDDERAWAPLARVQALAGAPGRVDRVWMSALIKPAPRGPAPDPVRDPHGYERYMCTAYPANIASDLSEHLAIAEVLPLSEVVAGEGRVVDRLNFLMLLLALAALSASTLGLLSTTAATVVERGREIGLLRSLGADPRQIAALLLGENALVAIGGGALGWLAGGVAAALIRGSVFGAGTPLQPLLLPVAIALALVVALVGTLGPLRAALRLDPAQVLRG
jgi:putative ABC transport system permease protein